MTVLMKLVDLVMSLLKVVLNGTIIFDGIKPVDSDTPIAYYWAARKDKIALFQCDQGILVVMHGGPDGAITPNDHRPEKWYGWLDLAAWLKGCGIKSGTINVCACYNNMRKDEVVDGFKFKRANVWEGPCFSEVFGGNTFVILNQDAMTIINVVISIIKRMK